MIIIPKIKIAESRDPVDFSNPMEGWFKLEVLKADSSGKAIEKSARVVADWFPNLITDQGLDRVGTTSDYLAWCQVGSGNTTPSNTLNQMVSFVASTSFIQATLGGVSGVIPYYGFRRNTYEFSTGTAAGVLAEVGVGWGGTATGVLFSRALILDGGGLPTTITVLSDEILRVTYECRNYAPASDGLGNVTITGVGTLNFTARASRAADPTYWGNPALSGSRGGFSDAFSSAIAFNGSIGTVTGFPSGATSTVGTVTLSAYTPGTYQRDAQFEWGLTQGNLSGGITALEYYVGQDGSTMGQMQLGFSSAIPKTASQIFRITLRHIWSRRP